MESIVFLAVGAVAGLIAGLAAGWSRWGRRRVERARAVDTELQAARQRAERATGEAQALRTRLVSAEVTAGRAAAIESDLERARHEAEMQTARADRLERELAVLRVDEPGAAWPLTDATEPAPWPSAGLEPAGTGADWGDPVGTHGADAIDPAAIDLQPSMARVETGSAAGPNDAAAAQVLGSAAPDVPEAPGPAVPAPDSPGDLDATPAEASSRNGTGPARPRRSPRRGVRRPRATSTATSQPMELPPQPPDPEEAATPGPVAATREAAAPPGLGVAAAPPAVLPSDELDVAPPTVQPPPMSPPASDGVPDRREEPDPAAWLGTIAPNGVRFVEDDLQRIHGVGPFLARRLNDAGIRTWRQIAMWDEDQMAAWSRRVGSFPDRIRREDWVGSARSLHEEAYGERIP